MGPLNWVSWGPPRGQPLQGVGLDTIQAWLAVPQPLAGTETMPVLELTAVSPLPQGWTARCCTGHLAPN